MNSNSELVNFFFLVATHNPWAGMTNYGMKLGKNTVEDAQEHLKYLDNDETAYTPLEGLVLKFDDTDGPNPFRIEVEDGNLLLKDHKATNLHFALCQKEV